MREKLIWKEFFEWNWNCIKNQQTSKKTSLLTWGKIWLKCWITSLTLSHSLFRIGSSDAARTAISTGNKCTAASSASAATNSWNTRANKRFLSTIVCGWLWFTWSANAYTATSTNSTSHPWNTVLSRIIVIFGLLVWNYLFKTHNNLLH